MPTTEETSADAKTALPITYTSWREGDEFRGPRPRALRLIRVPGPDLRDNAGALSGMGPELAYEFGDGLLVVNEQLIERDRNFLAQRAQQLHYDFDGDPRTVEWLEGHEDFNLQFFRQPDIAPPAGPLLSEITDAALDGDLDRLADIHERECETYSRPEVLEPVRRAIERLEARNAEQEARDFSPAPEAPTSPAAGPVAPG